MVKEKHYSDGHAELSLYPDTHPGFDRLAKALNVRLIGGVDDYATQYRIGRNKYFDRYPYDATWAKGVSDGYLAAKREDEARHDYDPMSEFDSNGTA